MSRVRQLLFVAALGVGAAGCRSVGPGEVQLPEKLDPRLTSNARACVERLNRDRSRAQRAMQTSDLLVLLGASAGAAGSIAAAFLTKPAARRASAVVGAVGALTAGAPKTLDDPADILTRRSRAERHWVVGYKVLTQTALASEPPAPGAPLRSVMELSGEPAQELLAASGQQRQKALLYVLDRFIDCTADLPPENFDELPASGFLAVGNAPVASLKGPNAPDEGTAKSHAASTVLLYVEPPSTTPQRELPTAPPPGASDAPR
jgi:hypothetical protein